MHINRVRLPATLFSVSVYRFYFSCLVSFVNTIFPFGLFSLFLLLTLLVMHLDQLYFKLNRSFILEKGLQKVLICILAKLATR